MEPTVIQHRPPTSSHSHASGASRVRVTLEPCSGALTRMYILICECHNRTIYGMICQGVASGIVRICVLEVPISLEKFYSILNSICRFLGIIAERVILHTA